MRVTLFVAVIAVLSSLGQGSLYDLWTNVVPGYQYFRYPAKWTPFFAWGVCFAGACGLSAWFDKVISNTENDEDERKRNRIVACLARMLLASGSVGIVVCLVHVGLILVPGWLDTFYEALKTVPVDPWTGVLHRQSVVRHFGIVGIGVAVVGICSGLMALRRFWNGVIGLCLIELGGAAVSQTAFVEKDVVINAVNRGRLDSNRIDSRPIEVNLWKFGDFELQWRGVAATQTGDSAPHSLQHLDDPSPLDETSDLEAIVAYQAGRMLGKFHLLVGVRSFDAAFTFRPRWLESEPGRMNKEFTGHRVWLSEKAQAGPSREPVDGVLFSNVSIRGCRIDFNYNSDQPVTLQLPIFDDGGWKIDRKDVANKSRVIPDASRLLMIELAAGAKRLSLNYWPPGLNVGIAISLLSLGLSCLLVCRSRST
jgi:hypothetical protein